MMSKEVRASAIIHWTSGAAVAFVSCVSSPTVRGSEEVRKSGSEEERKSGRAGKTICENLCNLWIKNLSW
jgi:hypothetical protein